MELRTLRYFVRIAEAGSISAASRQLRVAQPALTRHIRNLEKELGVSLFERTARGLLLSDAARQLLADGRQILADLARAKSRAQSFAPVIKGSVTVGITPSVSMILTNPLLKNMQRQAPSISLRIVDSMAGNGSEWLEWIRDEHLDLVVMYANDNQAGLKSEPLLSEDLHLVSPMRRSEDREISFEALSQISLVLPSRTHPLRQIVDRAAEGAGISARVVREVDSLLETKSAIRWEGLCSILSPCAIWEERLHADFLALRIINPSLPRRLDLIGPPHERGRPTAGLTRRVISSTVCHLVETGLWDATIQGPL
jgi:LysR family transcriptional regulator, nitrogen assimilation regulatory protein